MTYFISVAGCMICLLVKTSTIRTFIKFLSQYLLCWVVVIMSGLRSFVVSFATPDSLLSPGRSY